MNKHHQNQDQSSSFEATGNPSRSISPANLPVVLPSATHQRLLAALRANRRGTFLVLVVGTLAMLSIIMIVYVAVGNADQRTSRGVTRRNRSSEIVDSFADHIAQVIADDVTATVPDEGNKIGAFSGHDKLFTREAWDAPRTDWVRDSKILAGDTANAEKFFSPAGRGDDPWLASTTPTWINYTPQQNAPDPTNVNEPKTFTKRVDWLHISNLAPDGRFVNLVNLRDGFDAQPGIGNGRMSTGLSLFDATTGDPSTRTVWNNPAQDVRTGGNSSIPSLFDSWQVNAFRPAQPPFKRAGSDILPSDSTYPPNQWADADGDGFFDSRWFEMVDARTGGSFDTPLTWNTLVPNDPNYRWIFAARVVDLSSLVNVNVATDLNANPNDSSTLLDEKGDTVASGLSWQYGMQVLGRSPAEVDLRRLLTMRDFREVILGKPATAGGNPVPLTPADSIQIADVRADNNAIAENRVYNGGYSGLRQPLPPVGVAPKSLEDYSAYNSVDPPSGLSGITVVPNQTPANDINIGLGAYQALRGSAAIGRAPARFSDFSTGPLAKAGKPMGSQDLRWQSFLFSSGTVERPVYRANAQGNYRDQAGFDFGFGFRSDALLELLTYRGTNDPAVTSSLEVAMGGRASSELKNSPSINTQPVTVSPLRENRSLEIERANLSYANGKTTEAALLKSYTDVRQYLTTISGARPLVSRVESSTTVDPWLSTPSDLSTSDTSVELSEKTSSTNVFLGYVNALMPGLPSGLPVSSKMAEAWDESNNASKELRGLFYGHQGPLTALLTAAHMAANFDSGAKLPTDTTRSQPYTLVLSEDYQKDGNSTLPTDISPTSTFVGLKQYFPAWWQGRQFNLARPESTRTSPTTLARIPTTTGAPANLPVPAVNVYGTGDPHPFLVEVASFTVYRDTPSITAVPTLADTTTANPSLPESLTDYTGPAYQNATYITVNGDLDLTTNPDFAFRALVIKVHNPHPVPVTLSTIDSGSAAFSTNTPGQQIANAEDQGFYVKVGDTNAKYYVLCEIDETEQSAAGVSNYTGNFVAKPVIIQPGETIAFYALSEDSKKISFDRLGYWDRDLNTQGLSNSSTSLRTWLDNQLPPKAAPSANGIRRVQMARVDAAFGAAAASPSASYVTFARDLLVPANGQDATVAMFKAVRSDNGATVNDKSGPNSAVNDRLCDRMHLGTSVVLDKRLTPRISQNSETSPETAIVGLFCPKGLPASASKEDPQIPSVIPGNPAGLINRNTRFMVTIGVACSRPSDPSGAGLAVGMLPAWAIDPKEPLGTSWYTVTHIPKDEVGPVVKLDATKLDASKNDGIQFWGYTPKDWRLLVPALLPSLKAHPKDSTVPAIGDNSVAAKFADIRRELASNGLGYRAKSVDSNPDTFQARPADMLAVLGVGPYETPVDATGAPITDLKKRWTTTAEALAIALGYSKKPADRDTWKAAGNNYGPLDYYYFDRYSTAANPAPLYDGGYLKLNDYVCSRIDNTDPTKLRYYPSGNGAPIAGNVLNAFRTMPDRFAGLQVSTPGLVNINTAPSAVLRVLPLAFPAEDVASTSTNAVSPAPRPTFWPAIGGKTAVVAAQRTDIAAMIESYRDKIAVELRPGAKNPDTTKAPYAATMWFAPFFDRNAADATANNVRVPPNDTKIGDPTQTTRIGARYWTTGINGLREEPGFRSLGELTAVRAVAFDPTTGAVTKGADFPSNIDFLGHTPASELPNGTNLLGIDNVLELAADASGNVTGAKPLQFANTNQDRLKIIAALGGSATVRSDLYAAWFVVRGYQRSDVEGLEDDQPMVPSIERRFLMIIDRSNVVKPGQRPRIVAMVELPK